MTTQSKAFDLPSPTKVALAEVLVAKSRLGKSYVHQQALDAVIKLLGEKTPDHILAMIAVRKSILARLRGDYRESEDVIIDYQQGDKSHAFANARLRALNRLLLISHLENLIQLEHFEDAEKEIDDLNKWEPVNHTEWSPMESSVNLKKWSTVSKIYQSDGRLKTARSYLDGCYPLLRTNQLRDEPNRFQIICRLSDLLCAEGSFADARSKIENEIRSITTHGKLAKALRRLKVSLVEVSIAEERYDEASSDVEWLKKQYDNIGTPDISDQWLHLRSTVASARLLHYQSRFQDAMLEWEHVISLVRKYANCFEPEGFYYGLAQLSISVARIKISKNPSIIPTETWYADSRQAFNQGCAILALEKINYWIPTIYKKWIPDVLSDIMSAEPVWTETGTFINIRQRYLRSTDSGRRHNGFSSRI